MSQYNALDEVPSNPAFGSQPMLSRSQSRMQSSIQKIDSHVRSTLPYLQGKGDKKYIYMKIHNFFDDNKIEGYKELSQLLREQFEDKIDIKLFKDTKELLKDNYNDN
jgi:GH25 family lysozyme M1 (1,4-beta-N-acetylmuramidase)